MGRRLGDWVGWALVILTGLTFFGVGQLGFVNYDDDCYVTANPQVTGGLSLAGVGWAFRAGRCANWHPLTWLSLQTDATLFGVGPVGFHLANLAWHALAVLLVYFALAHLTGARWRAAAVAALFAVHPLRVESVAWVA